MLSSEEATIRLEAIANPAWREDAVRRIGGLDSDMRAVASAFLGPDPGSSGAPNRQAVTERLDEAGAEMDEMPERQRLSVCTALHPKLGHVLAKWWVDAQAQPYASGVSRRVFRAPRTPSYSRRTRIQQLLEMIARLGPFDEDAEWLAGWAAHLDVQYAASRFGFGATAAGPLLASAIDIGGPEGDAVVRRVISVANGEDPVGSIGRYVFVALLACSRSDAWKFVFDQFRAAGRQEGLRQAILESAVDANRPALLAMLQLLVSTQQYRSAAATLALNIWFGFPTDGSDGDHVADRLEQFLALFRNLRDAVDRASTGDAWDSYLSLCALGLADAPLAAQTAEDALNSTSVEVRSSAVGFLDAANVYISSDRFAQMLGDPDLRVALDALTRFRWRLDRFVVEHADVLDQLVERLPAKAQSLPSPGIEGGKITVSRAAATKVLTRALSDTPFALFLRWLPSMDVNTRLDFLWQASNSGVFSPDRRAALLHLCGNKSGWVQESAISVVGQMGVAESEAPQLEQLLTRSTSKIRTSVLGVLAAQPVPAVLRSVERLWTTKNESQRDAACELLASCRVTADGVVVAARQIQERQPTARQLELLGELVSDRPEVVPSAADDVGLGLYNPEQRAPTPKPRKVTTARPEDVTRSLAIVQALDGLAEAHRDTPVSFTDWNRPVEVLLGDAERLPKPFERVDAPATSMLLPEVFEDWWERRPPEMRGQSDGLDALRALAVARADEQRWRRSAVPDTVAWCEALVAETIGVNAPRLRYPVVVSHVLRWMLAKYADAEVLDESLDTLETAFASISDDRVERLPRERPEDEEPEGVEEWRMTLPPRLVWEDVPWDLLRTAPQLFDDQRLSRWFGLLRWFDEPAAGVKRHPVPTDLLLQAHTAGIATDHDVHDAMVHSPEILPLFTQRRSDRHAQRYPAIAALADTLRQRVIELEMGRGDVPTRASRLALRLGSIEGASVAFELLSRLRGTSIVTGWVGSTAKDDVFSHLLLVSYPAPSDSVDSMRALVKSRGLQKQSLIDLAVFAPQWADTVEQLLGWDGLADAVWWFHAHAKDRRWSVPTEVRADWEALSAERTPVSGSDLLAGVVDVKWFLRAHRRLGAARWASLNKSAKLSSSGQGAKRAQLFAAAMLGDLDEATVVGKIESIRDKDWVCALGLIPLPADPTRRTETALDRYRVIQEFRRGSGRFGAQRRDSEATAARVAIDNLARAAGYDDVQRFVWAMEIAEAGDLEDGPVTVNEGDVSVVLSIDGDGAPQLTVRRRDKPLAAIPAKVRKVPAVAELVERKAQVSQQASRVRASLEAAMVNLEHFDVSDLLGLCRHPVVAPRLNALVLIDEAGQTMWLDGTEFRSVTSETIVPVGRLRIAHPVDLAGGHWSEWQRLVFARSITQPFKQVFRELYIPTSTETTSGTRSQRWEGHQVRKQQAAALFGTRGWQLDRSSGDVWKVFHSHQILARLTYTDRLGNLSELESPTIDSVLFQRPGRFGELSIDQVPSVVFSEAMRDVDLVVSVAHGGGVDPEASASTMEMRETLVRETARLMKLDNVRMVGHHVIIEGVLGEYSVHLGSATVHRRPGGALCIIPVAAQRRGRLFLPFADDDPKSAELLSKVLLLAKDSTIKDPSILEQLRS